MTKIPRLFLLSSCPAGQTLPQRGSSVFLVDLAMKTRARRATLVGTHGGDAVLRRIRSAFVAAIKPPLLELLNQVDKDTVYHCW
ncbi:hypothetical protein DENSPDRAFT_709254 [Dentipellis sp. KUC8613]|nr:hypothetical protein DENSPDRAFT_709254 [Dentipellis sp. KUC8613]